jgi:hypothetical protein
MVTSRLSIFQFVFAIIQGYYYKRDVDRQENMALEVPSLIQPAIHIVL